MTVNLRFWISAALSGLLLFLAFPPFHLFFPSFVALVPITAWIVEQKNSRVGRARAFRGGFCFGVIYWGLILHWIPLSLWKISPWSFPAYVALTVLLALPKASFAWVLHHLFHEARISVCLALALCWTGLDWLVGNLPGALSFPWLELGTSLTGYPQVVGSAELVGTRGITFWIALLNGLLVEMIIQIRQEVSGYLLMKKMITAALIFSIPVSWGIWRSESLSMVPVGEIAVVQPNVIKKTNMSTMSLADSTFSTLQKMNVDRMNPSSDLIVLPEATFWNKIEADRGIRKNLSEVFRDWPAPVLFGGIGTTVNDLNSTEYNSAFLFNPREGLTDFRYDKHYLVPWFETMPFSLFDWRVQDLNFSQYGRGSQRSIGELPGGMNFGVLICYESIFAEHSRILRKGGADILVNMTNDAWLQAEWGTLPYRTFAFWQHPSHLIMRAIENRVGVVRSANTGFSFFVDPLGKVYGQLESSKSNMRRETVHTTSGLTFYARFGDLIGLVSFVGTILMLLNGRFRFQDA